jgi:hypothetical protein
MPQENSQNQLTTEARTVLGRLELTEWGALETALHLLAHKADVTALSDLLNKRPDEATEEAMKADVYRGTIKAIKGLLK